MSRKSKIVQASFYIEPDLVEWFRSLPNKTDVINSGLRAVKTEQDNAPAGWAVIEDLKERVHYLQGELGGLRKHAECWQRFCLSDQARLQRSNDWVSAGCSVCNDKR